MLSLLTSLLRYEVSPDLKVEPAPIWQEGEVGKQEAQDLLAGFLIHQKKA